MRYYYTKNGFPAYSLKQPVQCYPEIDATDLVEITEEEWLVLTEPPIIEEEVVENV